MDSSCLEYALPVKLFTIPLLNILNRFVFFTRCIKLSVFASDGGIFEKNYFTANIMEPD